ncbi:hypothetical protein D5086_016105 [Populus alba]|uniref:Uncharacterized protein n=1 Tax=Populus alba TaxID=43335 RepID=A0ACC4BT39_POPAL
MRQSSEFSFLRWKDFVQEGILVQGGHGTFVSSCFLGQHSTVGRGPGERDFSGTAIDLWSNDNAISDVLFSAAIVVLSRGQSNIPLGVLNVVTGKAPDIGNASCASPEVFCPSSNFFSVFFMIAQHCPGQSNCVSKRHNVDISCFLHLVQVRKITFTGSPAVGKKLMAVAAGTVKRVSLTNLQMLFQRLFRVCKLAMDFSEGVAQFLEMMTFQWSGEMTELKAPEDIQNYIVYQLHYHLCLRRRYEQKMRSKICIGQLLDRECRR